MTTAIALPALNGGGQAISLRADQNVDTSVALRASLEFGGVAVSGSNQVPVTDSAAESSLASLVTSQGTGGTSIAQPSGGAGILGWLSGIYSRLSGTLAVSGTFWQATQPVSVAALPALTAGSAAIGTVGVTALPALPTGTNTIGAVTQASFALTNSVAGTMGTAAAIAVPFSGTRKWLLITNRSAGTETQDIGSSNVVVGSGIPLAPGAGFLFNGAGAAGPIYGITTVPGSAFSYVEG